MSVPSTAPLLAGDELVALRTWLRLLACGTLVEREVRRRLRERFDTTLPRFDLLAQLDAAEREGRPGLTMSELSRRLMVTNGNLTGLVERLAREKLVTRTAAPGDRRIQLVRLTTAGAEAFGRMAPDHHEWIAAMFAGLSTEETAQLHGLLGRLRGSIRDSLTDPDTGATPT